MTTCVNPDKFGGHKPLLEYITNHYAQKYELEFYQFEEPKKADLFDLYDKGVVTKKILPFEFGIRSQPEEFTRYDFLHTYSGPAFVVHERVIKIFQEMCPDDFQRFDAVIKNYNPDDSPFENREFHMINVVHKIEALDMEKSTFRESPNGLMFVKKRVFRDDDCWNGHLLAREEQTNDILFHPKLAKKFRRSKGIQFLTDTEAP